jgi:predicted nucleic acid-binding protein
LYKKQSRGTIDQAIIEIVKKNNPKTVNELINLVQPKYAIPEKDILERILNLQNQGKIALKNHQAPVNPLLRNYVFSSKASWYWTIIAVAAATASLVFTVPENAVPIVYARYVLGAIFVLFLPGYTFIRALFPEKELDNIERTALSMGMSLALVPITGLILNYTPWGIRTTPVTLSLLALTTIFATAAITREHQTKTKQNKTSEHTRNTPNK